jgi:hypothetical protein
MDWFAVTATALGALTAVVSAIAAVASARSARAANDTATKLASLEIERRHAELTPVFAVETFAQQGGYLRLTVKLIGPTGLDRLDKLTASVRDDSVDRRSDIVGGATDEQIVNQVWGPWRFSPGVDGAPASGRRVKAISLALGHDRPFQMERTNQPPWNESEAFRWSASWDGKPLQLNLDCERDGYSPWTVPVDVKWQ